MVNDFERISKQESNEKTALILMLGVLSEKLSDIGNSIKELRKLSSEMLLCIKENNELLKNEDITPLSKEDYLD